MSDSNRPLLLGRQMCSLKHLSRIEQTVGFEPTTLTLATLRTTPVLCLHGGEGWVRTNDNGIFVPPLYLKVFIQIHRYYTWLFCFTSYWPSELPLQVVELVGLEPTATWSSIKHSTKWVTVPCPPYYAILYYTPPRDAAGLEPASAELSEWESNPRFLVYQTSALTAWLPDNVLIIATIVAILYENPLK